MDITSIKGDGNCFFRCVSYLVAGNERSHGAVRDTIFAFMHVPRIDLQLREMYAGHQPAAMGRVGTWATECEILVTAAFTETDIVVFTDNGWVTYAASVLGQRSHSCKMYMRHFSRGGGTLS